MFFIGESAFGGALVTERRPDVMLGKNDGAIKDYKVGVDAPKVGVGNHEEVTETPNSQWTSTSSGPGKVTLRSGRTTAEVVITSEQSPFTKTQPRRVMCGSAITKWLGTTSICPWPIAMAWSFVTISESDGVNRWDEL